LKRIIIACLTALFAVLIVAPTGSAAIRIVKIYFDSPGADTGSNSSLNDEWIRLKNTGTRARSLTKWRVHDRGRDHLYIFGTYTLGAGKTVTIHTGRGSNTARNRYWRLDNYVWNNDGDKATLKKPNGTIVDTCSYSGAGSFKVC
jgi:hypothetical protein